MPNANSLVPLTADPSPNLIGAYNPNSVAPATADPSPNLIGAYIAKEMANFAFKSSAYQVTIRLNSRSTMDLAMATIPAIGEEIAVSHGNGREQVYRVVNIRHNAYANTSQLKYSNKNAVTIWCELIQRPSW